MIQHVPDAHLWHFDCRSYWHGGLHGTCVACGDSRLAISRGLVCRLCAWISELLSRFPAEGVDQLGLVSTLASSASARELPVGRLQSLGHWTTSNRAICEQVDVAKHVDCKLADSCSSLGRKCVCNCTGPADGL